MFAFRVAARGPAIRTLASALAATAIFLSQNASAVPGFASQTGMPCSQCHTQSYGPQLTAYGRQFKLNGYTLGDGEHPMPIALMLQGGFSHVDADLPQPAAPHYAVNNNLSLDQVSLFYGGRITEHLGAFVQGTYSGPDRNASWDNTDIRYARAVDVGGVDAVIGISINNNPTVQDLWNTTPAWGFPYITSPLVPGPAGATLIEGGLAQLVLGATAYAMIHDHLYVEAGAYRGLSDRWLNNVGVGADNSPHMSGAAPYWRLAYQTGTDPYYFSVGTFGLEAKLQPDPSVPDTDRYTDLGFDATWQYNDGSRYALTVNAAYIHENQRLTATFNAGGADAAANHLNTARIDADVTWLQTWSFGTQLFDISGNTDLSFYGAAPLNGSNNGSPDTRGYILQLECVPFGKLNSWGSPWVNVRTGLQYTGYFKFNGGNSNYDGFGRNARQNNALFAFLWLIF